MSRFNATISKTRTTNLAGGKAFSMNPELELTHAVLTSFLKDKYYESGDDRATRIAALVEQVAKKDSKFVAQLAKVARSEFHLRSVTTVLLGALSKAHRGDDLVKRAIVASTERVDDLMELAAYVGKPIPKQVKRGIRNALFKFNRYQLAKYRGDGKEMSLVDLFNLVHPKAQHADADQKKAWEDLMKGELKSTDTWEVEVSATKGDKEKKEAWEKLVRENKMGYMALLRNLNNLIKSGVEEDVIDAAVKKLTDPEQVKKSRQLPFRFYTASQIVKGNRKLADAISDAMDLSVANVPRFDGKMLIAVDTSGSMSSGDESNTPLQKAAVFAAALIKSNDADVLLYDTSIKELVVSSRSTILDLAEKIMTGARRGGTKTSLVFAYATAAKIDYDRIIILSDNESWVEHYGGNNVQSMYELYRKNRGADPFIYAIDIQGYGTTEIQKTPKVFHLTGWSERLLDFIGAAEKGDTLLEHIRSIEI